MMSHYSNMKPISVAELQDKIEQSWKAGKGRRTCTCGAKLDVCNMEMYPHEGGIEITGEETRGEPVKSKQWVYIHCYCCGYDWAIWKLRIEGGL